MTPQRSHPFLRPAIAAPGQQAISIECTGDHVIRTDSRQYSHGIDDLFRCVRAILPTTTPGQTQLRVHATLPVDDEIDFTRRWIHIHDNLMDQRSNNAFFQANISLRTIPHSLQFGCEILKLFPCGCRRFLLTMDVLLDSLFDLLNSLQGLIPAALQFVGYQTVLRIRRIILLLGTLRRIARHFQVWLANYYFARDSLGFSVPLRFCDA